MNKKIDFIPAISIILLCSFIVGAVVVLITLQMSSYISINYFEELSQGEFCNKDPLEECEGQKIDVMGFIKFNKVDEWFLCGIKDRKIENSLLGNCIIIHSNKINIENFADKGVEIIGIIEVFDRAVYESGPPIPTQIKAEEIKILSNSSYTIPDGNLCKYTDSGWLCYLVLPSKFKSEDRYKYGKAKEILERTCEEQGGTLKCYGFCEPYYEHYCDFPFNDAGKECINSDQCEGKCVIGNNYVERNYPNRNLYFNIEVGDKLKGTCSLSPRRACDWWFEVNNGVIENHTGVLCD